MLIGEDPSDIGKLWTKLVWAGASVGPQRRGHPGHRRVRHRAVGPEGQAGRPAAGQAARLPPRFGAAPTTPPAASCTPRSSRSRRTPATRWPTASAASRSRSGSRTGGSTSPGSSAVREHLGDDVPLMVDANQQWDRPTAHADGPDPGAVRPGLDRGAAGCLRRRGPRAARRRAGHPDRHRRNAGQRRRARRADRGRSVDIIQPDAPRIGGITQFLQARRPGRVQAACSSRRTSRWRSTCTSRPPTRIEPWVEHFDWLDPLFNERLEITDGRMHVSGRPGLGFTLSDQAHAWTVALRPSRYTVTVVAVERKNPRRRTRDRDVPRNGIRRCGGGLRPQRVRLAAGRPGTRRRRRRCPARPNPRRPCTESPSSYARSATGSEPGGSGRRVPPGVMFPD